MRLLPIYALIVQMYNGSLLRLKMLQINKKVILKYTSEKLLMWYVLFVQYSVHFIQIQILFIGSKNKALHKTKSITKKKDISRVRKLHF